MNTIKSALAGSASAAAVNELSRAFGTPPEATRRAVAHVADEISRRLERNTLSRGGLAELVRAVGDSHHEVYLRDPRLLRSAAMERDGKAILSHIFWTKDASRGVAARAARASGLGADTVENMLPSIAALSMGELTRAAAGPFDEILRRIPGLDEALQEMQRRGANDSGRGSSGGFDLPNEDVPRQPQGTDMQMPRDMTAGGNGSLPHQEPLPVPGEIPSPDRGGSRYDDLSDILGRGGFRIPSDDTGGGFRLPQDIPGGNGGVVSGTLYNIVRAILGALLGFQSRGFIGWLVRLVVMRWGWNIVRRVLGRVLGRVALGR